MRRGTAPLTLWRSSINKNNSFGDIMNSSSNLMLRVSNKTYTKKMPRSYLAWIFSQHCLQSRKKWERHRDLNNFSLNNYYPEKSLHSHIFNNMSICPKLISAWNFLGFYHVDTLKSLYRWKTINLQYLYFKLTISAKMCTHFDFTYTTKW